MSDPGKRDNDVSHLHPACRAKVETVLDTCSREGLPFKVFEGFRAPHRQQFLYNQGRSRPGQVVTNAGPWSSIHQYGLAADFVHYETGKWSWDASGEKRRWWSRLHEIGRAQGLEPLRWEAPNLQLSGLSVADLQAGRYLAGGDTSWSECLKGAIVSWNGVQSEPDTLGHIPDRPPLAAEFPEMAPPRTCFHCRL